MLRSSSLTVHSAAHALADVGVVIGFCIFVAIGLACVAVVDLFTALLERWPTVLLVVALLVWLCGCATAPKLDPRDPEVWRPSAPAVYPLPQ